MQKDDTPIELVESEMRLRLATQAAGIGIWTWDCVTDAVFWSPECGEIMGVASWDGTRDDFSRRVHPDDAEALWTAVGEALSMRTQFRHEFRIIRGDGQVRWVLNLGRAEYSDAGTPTRMLGIIQDITERKEAASALAEAESKKGMLLLVVAHELRNFLAPIPSSVTILRHASATEQQRRFALNTIATSSDLLRRLLDELLDVGKIAQGRFVLKLEHTTFQEILATAMEAAASRAAEKKQKVTVRAPEETIPLVVDKLRLCQALANVFTNATKYTPEGGFIEISARIDDGSVVLTTRDSGVGFSREQQEDMFELYRQADDASSGVGVGLYLTRSFIELHGGSVEARSDGLGMGSVFELRIPLKGGPSSPAQGDP